jgi:SSS family solute:Na+ symporter
LNFAAADWVIVAVVYAILVAGMLFSKRYMRSVADFLAAGRTAGRYLISVSVAIAGVGAITIVGNLQMNFKAGFAMSWWGLSMSLVTLVIAVSGWVIYRFRSTRSLTLPEFFERRFSRKFRIASGMVCFLSGILNFAIFPSVGARFFIYFAGLPPEFDLLGASIETYPVLMFGLLATSLWFVFSGGQVSVIFTDFLQGLFANVVFIVIPVYLLFVVGWDQVHEVLSNQPKGESLINPFDTAHMTDFNFWYFLIGVFGVLLRGLGWQGEQAYNVSAKSAHEAKMGGVLSMWRNMPMGLTMLLVPILAAVVMQHPDWSGTAGAVTDELATVEHEAIQTQLKTPLVLARLLPAGLMGMFAAMMLAAFISTHDTYLHSWGSIFIQDVVMPFRKKPFKPGQHVRILRWSYTGVALFALVFSYFYIPQKAILFFFALTGAIFASWAGIVTIGGLYWKRGTTAGAWAALIVGASIAVFGGIAEKVWGDKFPLNGQEIWALGMGASILCFVGFSLITPRVFNLDRLLRRGKYEVEGEREVVTKNVGIGWRIFAVGPEFTRRDRVLYVVTYAWIGLQIAVFVVGTVINLNTEVTDEAWLAYWRIYIWVNVILSGVVILWFGIGGIRDIRRMLRDLSTNRRDDSDDGFVRREE